jgi:ABC-type amino acid transport substrate-binding protein
MAKYKFVRIATSPYKAPFEFGAGTSLQGLDIDIGKEIAAGLGYDVKWISLPQDKLLDPLVNEQAELLISAFPIESPLPAGDRRKLAFSKPYFTSFDTLARRNDKPAIRDFRSLAGDAVGVQSWTTAAEFLESQATAGKFSIRPFPTLDDGLSSLSLGAIDAMAGDATMLNYSIHQSYRNLIPLQRHLTETHFVIVTRIQEQDILRKVNATLDRLNSTGKMEQIVRKWLR